MNAVCAQVHVRSTQSAQRAGWTPCEETDTWSRRDSAALGVAVAWQSLVNIPREPQVQLSLRASVPGVGAVGLCPGVPLGGASSVTADAARAVERTVLEGKGFLNRPVFSARFQPGPCPTLQPELAPSWNRVPSVRPDFEAESAQTRSQVRELPLDAAAVQAAGVHHGVGVAAVTWDEATRGAKPRCSRPPPVSSLRSPSTSRNSGTETPPLLGSPLKLSSFTPKSGKKQVSSLFSICKWMEKA